jgi:hypothetical protein
MAKFLHLINLDEIKVLRITCEKCHASWSVLVESGESDLQKKCNCNAAVIPNNHLKYIVELLKNKCSIQKYLKGFKISIELEKEEPPK